MDPEASYMFTHAICRRPGRSVVRGLRASDAGDPDFAAFAREHAAYVDALADAGVAVSVQDPLENYPDSVFVEDPALCVAGAAIILRPGAPSRCQSGSASTSKPSPSLRISKRPSVTARTHRADFFSPPSG